MRAPWLLAAVTLVLNGCVFGAPDIEPEVDVLAWEMRPLELEPQTELSIGRALLGLAGTVVRWSDDDEAAWAAELLSGVTAVHIGAYRLEGRRSLAPAHFGADAREGLLDLGWKAVVRTNDGDDSHWVLARENRRGRFELLLVGLETRDLTVVKVEGDLGALLDVAVRRERDLLVIARRAGEDL